MNKKMQIILIAAVILTAAAILVYKNLPGEPQIKNTQRSAGSQALLGKYPGKPVWLLFKSSTCYPCQQMLQTMNELRPEFEGRIGFVVIEVNDPANQELARDYKVQYVPATFLYDKNHRLVDQHVGALDPDSMRAKLRPLVEAQS